MRSFRKPNLPVSLPADTQQPCARFADARWAHAPKSEREGRGETLEPLGGREGIERGAGRAVLEVILEHVAEGVAHFAWGFEGVAVPAISPQATSSREQLVHSAG